ncbi:MAG: hypothetical protein NT157_01990 [Candidatus Micrarchaeota archaeon]|nr:hypothetical protein [Candidatus Micrarchaeota archaeon]
MKDLGPLSNRKMAEYLLEKQSPDLHGVFKEALARAETAIKKNFTQFGWDKKVEIEFKKLLGHDDVFEEFVMNPYTFSNLAQFGGKEFYNLLRLLNEDENARNAFVKNSPSFAALLSYDSRLAIESMKSEWEREFFNAHPAAFVSVFSKAVEEKNPEKNLAEVLSQIIIAEARIMDMERPYASIPNEFYDALAKPEIAYTLAKYPKVAGELFVGMVVPYNAGQGGQALYDKLINHPKALEYFWDACSGDMSQQKFIDKIQAL